MDLVVNQVMQFQVVHVADRRRSVKGFACTAVPKLDFSVPVDRHALPEFPVIPVVIQIFQDGRKQLTLMLLPELIPVQVYIVIGKFQGILDILFIRAVKYRRRDVESECHRRKAQMDLKDLSDVHTARNAQRIQNDIKRAAVRQERHILDREDPGDNTLVSVTACHLVADRDLSLLGDIDTHRLVDAGCQLVAVLPGKYLRGHHDAVFTVRHLQ